MTQGNKQSPCFVPESNKSEDFLYDYFKKNEAGDSICIVNVVTRSYRLFKTNTKPLEFFFTILFSSFKDFRSYCSFVFQFCLGNSCMLSVTQGLLSETTLGNRFR